MMTWPFLLCLAYLWVLITGVGLSFTTHKQPRRRNIRIATAALTTPIWLALGFFGFVWFSFFKKPPTLTELQRDFSSKRADLEMILVMSDEDVNFSRIAPDFLDRTPDEPNGVGRYMANDPKAGLSKPRWDSYRKIYSRNGIELGIQRDTARDAFIMVDSVGFLDQGHTTGYLRCARSAPADAYRYVPCTLQQAEGERRVDGDSGQEGYSFQKLDDRWYAYDEGPG